MVSEPAPGCPFASTPGRVPLAHAQCHAGYRFTGQEPELANLVAVVGTTVLADSVTFAQRDVGRS